MGYLRIRSFALYIHGREVLAPRHVHLERQILVVVLQGEFYLTCDDHGPAAASLTRAAVYRRHRVRTCLESRELES